jgi:dTMP kinase
MFIVLEGADGVGKSTHVRLLVQRLKDEFPERKVVQTMFPTNGSIGSFIRGLFSRSFGELPSWRIMTHLFMADREEGVENIRRWLLEGAIVVSDRYWLTGMVYQSTSARLEEGEEAEKQAVEMLLKAAENFPAPDVSIVLKVSEYEYGVRRKTPDAFEENSEFQRIVREKYARVEGDPFSIYIDTTDKSLLAVAAAIDGVVKGLNPWQRV